MENLCLSRPWQQEWEMERMLSIILNIGAQRSKTLASHLSNRAFGASILTVLILTSPVKSAQWRDIKPLRSTRNEVVKLLGKPKIDRPDYALYILGSERVSFEYSTGPCEVGQNVWKVSIGTVTRIWVEPTTQLPLSDVKLRMSDYKREMDTHVMYIYYLIDEYLIDEIRGIRYTVDGSSNLVTLIEYYPALDDHKYHC
jgi:hypothetical protein